MITLTDVYSEIAETRVATQFLYELLRERDETINISHCKMPSFEEHIRFVDSRPYREWFIIFDEWGNLKMGPIGSIYLTKPPKPSQAGNEIGIFIKKEFQGKGFGKAAICLLMNRHPGEHFLANINPHNARSIDLFEGLGFELMQVTYGKKTKC
jgi:RimJ/RimL family protein N-acetyltransferase